jgi:hypothetical protein
MCHTIEHSVISVYDKRKNYKQHPTQNGRLVVIPKKPNVKDADLKHNTAYNLMYTIKMVIEKITIGKT